ncbi:MAG: DUF6089 family protein [Lacibacter sp.]
MKKGNLVFYFVLFVFTNLNAQNVRLNLFAGTANYNGDLQSKQITFQQAKFSVGSWVSYDISSKIMLRGGLHYAQVQAADRYQSNPQNVLRNLSFATNIWELHAGGEYHFLGMDERVFSPYVFAGVAGLHFNPFAKDAAGNKIFLKPLSTEGQGLAAYPDRKPYSLTQFAIPFGIGVRMVLTDKVDVGVEFGYRKTFTDYMDDVSTSYINPAAFVNPASFTMSYRTPELAGHTTDPYPVEFEKRGGEKYKDNYYFIGITFSYKLTGKDRFSGFQKEGGQEIVNQTSVARQMCSDY